MRHIVIVGAGFAGCRLARKLAHEKGLTVTLINPSRDFRYTPALYRAATGFNNGVAWLPIEWMLLDSPNTIFVEGSVESIDTVNKELTLADHKVISYDDVVFAIGSVTSYFSIPGLDAFSYGVKSNEELSRLKQHVHSNILHPEKASKEYVIVGAGPTGVELAAVMGAHVRRISKRHHTSAAHISVHLVEAGPRILPQMSERAARYATKQLAKNGVRIHLNTQVKAETIHTLRTSLGTMSTDNVIWTAGTMNNPFFKQYPRVFPLDTRGRVAVNAHLEVSPHIYVCGDNAATRFSGLALTAITHADFIARDIHKKLRGKTRKTHADRQPMQVVPVGEKHAVFQYRGFILYGKLIGMVRKVADIVGYTDILGATKAFTVWRNSETAKDVCDICGR